MKKLKFSELDAAQKRAVSWLADEAGTITPTILAATAHVGELWEAKAFLMHFTKGTAPYEQLSSRLRLGDTTTESIFDAIKRIAPTYATLEQRSDAELGEVLSSLTNASAGGACTCATVKRTRPKPKRQTDEEFFMSLDDDFVEGLVLALEATLEAPPK